MGCRPALSGATLHAAVHQDWRLPRELQLLQPKQQLEQKHRNKGREADGPGGGVPGGRSCWMQAGLSYAMQHCNAICWWPEPARVSINIAIEQLESSLQLVLSSSNMTTTGSIACSGCWLHTVLHGCRMEGAIPGRNKTGWASTVRMPRTATSTCCPMQRSCLARTDT
jgi:hypothetical protein